MKSFIKVLRHYADFSGRAPRKEYWMFALFNFIFFLGWFFISALFTGLKGQQVDGYITGIMMSWFGLMVLPGMAVTVRRLHDLGKSGWMLLIGLIPAVGAIWLFILMVKDGERGKNRYGSDPKTSPETFYERPKMASAGTALIVASIVSILSNLMAINYWNPFNLIYFLALDGLLLTSGIMLFNSMDRHKTKRALVFLLVPSAIIFLRGVVNWMDLSIFIESWGWRGAVSIFISPLFYLCAAVFAAANAFSSNPKLARNTSLLLIVAACVSLLWWTFRMEGGSHSDNLRQVVKHLGFISWPAYMVIAWTFLSKKEQPAIESSDEEVRYEADEKIVYQPSSSQTPGVEPQGGSGSSLVWKIIGLFVSIGLIAGGLSGEMVLRGSNSSEALVIVGLFFLIADIFALATHNKGRKRKEEFERQLADGTITISELATPATIRVVRDSSVVGAIVSYKVYLNHGFVGKIKNGKSLDIETHVSHNVITVFDNNDNPFRGDFTVDLQEGGYAEVHVKAGRFVK